MSKAEDSKVIVPETVYAKDAVHQLAPVIVDQSADGWSVKISCEKWPVKTMGKFRVMADFGGKAPIVLFEGGISGGGTDKQGNPCQFASIRGTWPGESDGKGGRAPIKAGSITVEFEPVENLAAAVEIDAALKASSVEIIADVEIPIP